MAPARQHWAGFVKRRIIILLLALLLIPAVLVAWALTSESGLRWGINQLKQQLPGTLEISQLHGSLYGPMQFTQVRYQYQDTEFTSDKIILDWHPIALFSGSIEIQQLQLESALLNLPVTNTTDEKTNTPLPDVYLPWRLVLNDIEANNFTVSYGEQQHLFQHIQLNGDTLLNYINIQQLNIESEHYNVTLKGNLNPVHNYKHNLEIDWQLSLPQQPAFTGSTHLNGNLKQTALKQIISGPAKISIKGELFDLQETPHWSATVDAVSDNLKRLNESLPEASADITLQGLGDLNSVQFNGKFTGQHEQTGAVNGRYTLTWQATQLLDVETLTFNIEKTGSEIHARGQWQPGDSGGDIDIALDWQNLRWPLQESPWFNSAQGSGWLKGNLEHYQLGLASTAPWPQVPASQWYASASGDLEKLDIHQLTILAANNQGSAQASGYVDWQTDPTWNASVQLTRVNPAMQDKAWPGSIDAQLKHAGYIHNGELTLTTEIAQLKGTLRGYPVKLSGTTEWNDEGLSLQKIALQSGKSKALI